MGVLCSLALGPWEQTFPVLEKTATGLFAQYNFFDWLDKLSANFFLPDSAIRF